MAWDDWATVGTELEFDVLSVDTRQNLGGNAMFYGIITFFDTTLTALATGTKTPEQRWFNHSLHIGCDHFVITQSLAYPPPPQGETKGSERQNLTGVVLFDVTQMSFKIYAKICNLIVM